MKKILIALSLLLTCTTASVFAQGVNMWGNLACAETVTITLYGHDATHTGCGSISSGPIYVMATNNPMFSDMIAIDDPATCGSGSGPGWYFGVNPYCVTSLVGARWDGAKLSCTGCGGAAPVYIGGSACFATASTAWYTDCFSNTQSAYWSHTGSTLDVAVHY